MDAGVGLMTRCRSYNVVSEAENNGKECAYTQNFESCTTSGCEQVAPPPPPSNSSLITNDDDSSSDSSGQSSDDDKSAKNNDVSTGGEEGALDSEVKEDEQVSTASVSAVMIGIIASVAVCCVMGLAFVYVRQKRKREAYAQSSGQYQAVSQDSRAHAKQQSMLLMNPMFNLSGKSRKSTIAMKSGARMSFLSNPLFERDEEDLGSAMPSISESPQGSDAESSELLERNAMEKNSAYSNPLYSTKKGVVPKSEQDIEESMEALGKDFEASISQLSQCVVEKSSTKDLEFALTTWQELSSSLVDSTDEVTTNETITADKLHLLKQSLNKFEQGTLLNSSMSTNEKSDFCKLINQTRLKLRNVEKLHSLRRSRTSTAAAPELQRVRQKLKAVRNLAVKRKQTQQ